MVNAEDGAGAIPVAPPQKKKKKKEEESCFQRKFTVWKHRKWSHVTKNLETTSSRKGYQVPSTTNSPPLQGGENNF